MADYVRPAKVHGSALPQEYLLEKILQDVKVVPLKIPVRSPFCWSTETPACKWRGVTCDAQGIVTKIYWGCCNLNGELHWEFLPKTLITFNARSNELRGIVELIDLPPGLESFSASYNLHGGTPDLRELPLTMKELWLEYNCFEGRVDLDALPKSMKALHLEENQDLSGQIDVSKLPPKLYYNIRSTNITMLH